MSVEDDDMTLSQYTTMERMYVHTYSRLRWGRYSPTMICRDDGNGGGWEVPLVGGRRLYVCQVLGAGI